jgi:hypothetical protein
MSKTPRRTSARLLGPPDLHHLLLTALPWESGVDLAAEDLTEQFVNYTREACAGREFPDVWYLHMVFAFAPQSSKDLRDPPDTHQTPQRGASQTRNAYRLVYDALNAFGWPLKAPALFVAHGDRKHIHVHAVLALVFPSGEVGDALSTSRSQLAEIAEMCANAFDLNIPTRAQRAHERYLKSLFEREMAVSED